MNKYFASIIIALAILSLEGCFDPPEYPIEPKISYEDIRYVEVDGQDSLILTFNFQDGDGDFGIYNDEVEPPFHRFNYVLDSSARFTYDNTIGEDRVIDATVRFVEYGDEGKGYPYYEVSNYGTLVATYSEESIVLPSYNSCDYLAVPDLEGDTTSQDVEDTLLITQNPYLNNLDIKFLRKRKGQLEDITELLGSESCSPPFNTRIPVFDDDNIGRPLNGSVSYPMLSSGFKSTFLVDSIVIEFFIYDRALHKSNVVRSQAFTLPGLLGIN